MVKRKKRKCGGTAVVTARRSGSVVLSGEQKDAIKQLLFFPKHIQTLGGYAGTGKTTLIKHLKAKLPGFAVIAFTGKAAHILRRKGIKSASTIHSCIYEAVEEEFQDGNGKLHIRIVFKLKSRDEILESTRGFVVDEASMVSQQLFTDLKSFELPIIFVGDHGQLEPVGDSFNLMTNPDITLETIHRNAGEIAHFANFIREGNSPARWRGHKKYTGEQVVFRSLDQATSCGTDVWQSYDQIIVAFNDTRVRINEAFREQLGYPPDRPVKGDRVMCLQNDSRIGVFNGMQGMVEAVLGNEMDFLADGEIYRVRFKPEQFNNPQRPKFEFGDMRLPFDYCYAITCHKAQGDEFDHAFVLEQRCPGWDHARWAYTAASRARRKLTWVCHDQI